MILMILVSFGAAGAFAGAISSVQDADSSVAVVESWRMLGFLVFAGLFLLLALRPRMYPGIWELAFFHKAGMAVAGVILMGDDAEGAGSVVVFDGVLAAVILIACILSRGFTAWGRWTDRT
jgi:hypothetical protein